MKPFQLSAVVASLLALTNAVHAATAFASRATFDAAFPGASIENFDSYAAGTTVTNGGTLNGITYNSSAGMSIVTSSFLPSTTPNSLGRTPTGFFDSIDTITFTFGTSLLAFGIDINSVATNTGAYLLTTNTGEVINSVFDPFTGFSTGQFAGFSTNLAFTSVTVSSTSLAYTVDTLRYVPVGGRTVPDYGVTLMLLGSAVGALLGVHRKLTA